MFIFVWFISFQAQLPHAVVLAHEEIVAYYSKAEPAKYTPVQKYCCTPSNLTDPIAIGAVCAVGNNPSCVANDCPQGTVECRGR